MPNRYINRTGDRPNISVCVVTYNQKKYIRQCIESIVEQSGDFDLEIIVGDDCSTDGTQDIIREFANKYKGKIIPIFNQSNMGAALNYKLVHALASGDYVAHVDGDDCMRPHKLQKQLDIFLKNSDCVMVTHDMFVVDEFSKPRSRTFKRYRSGKKTLMDLYETLPFFASSSKMIKADVDRDSIEFIEKNTIDIEIHVKIAEHGAIYHVDESLGVYRVGCGMSSSVGRVNELLSDANDRIFRSAITSATGPCLKRMKKFYAKHLLNYGYQAASVKNREQVRYFINKSLSVRIISAAQLAMYALSFFPEILFSIVDLRNRIRSR